MAQASTTPAPRPGTELTGDRPASAPGSRPAQQPITFAQRARYWFDNTMSRGTVALIAWLGVVTLVMILVVGLIIWFFGITDNNGQTTNPLTLAYWLFLHAIGSTNVSNDQGPWPYLGAMLVVTLGSIFLVSTLIGVLTTGISNQLAQLRKGRSLVIEEDHTLILGWSDQIFPIISELAIANANQGRPRIVILADKDKVEMEDAIRTQVGDTGKTRVICRSGDPMDLTALPIVNPQGARAIIVLASDQEDPDAQVIKTTLAITNNPQRRAAPYHIVGVIRDPRNLAAARVVGGGEARFVDTGDLVSRVIAQTCRQSGLSIIYTELLDFGGDEIYFQEEPALVGQPFGETLFAYERCAVLGLQSADGTVALNPPLDRRLAAGDRIIAIAEDDDKVVLSGPADRGINLAALQELRPRTPAPEQILILGWSRRAPAIINELDNYVAPGSTVTVVADVPGAEAELAARCAGVQRLTIRFVAGDTTDRALLVSLPLAEYAHVIILAYADTLPPQRADARTLVTLLHLRDLERGTGRRMAIVSEMLDDRNRALAAVAQADDFIVSDKLISLMLAQISENKHLVDVFADLFDPEGAEIYLLPAEDYVRPGVPVNFYTVLEAARRRSQIALGYSVAAEATRADLAYGVHLNPLKSQTFTLAAGDRIVVLADEG